MVFFYTWYHFLVDFMLSVRMFFCVTCFFQTLVFPCYGDLMQKGWTFSFGSLGWRSSMGILGLHYWRRRNNAHLPLFFPLYLRRTQDESINLQRPLSHPAHKTWGNYLFSTPSSILPCWQTCREARILNTSLLQHQRMPGGSPTWAPDEERQMGLSLASSQGEQAATQVCLEDERRMWDNPGTKDFLLWLSLDVKEKSAKNEVLAFPRSLSQRRHLTVNLYPHEDLYVYRHIHQ